MKTSKIAIAALLAVAPVAAFAHDHEMGATEAELAVPNTANTDLVMDTATETTETVTTEVTETVSGTVVEATGEAMDTAEHDHGTMKKAVDDAVDSAETLKKSAE